MLQLCCNLLGAKYTNQLVFRYHSHNQHWQPTHLASKIGGLALPPIVVLTNKQQVFELTKAIVVYSFYQYNLPLKKVI
jgi:hypothetical protein